MSLQIRTSPPASQEAAQTVEVDALPRLNHRSRRKAIESEAAAPGRYLVATDGAIERLIELTEPVVHVGRAYSADLRLDHQTVSRRHAIIVRRPDGDRVLDDRSANGTFVNGRRINEELLADGDVLVLGSVVLTYRVVAAASATSRRVA